MLGYYPGSFTGMAVSEVRVAHQQEQAALSRSDCAFYSSGWAVDTARQHYVTAPARVDMLPFGANLTVTHDLAGVERLIAARRNAPIKLLFIGVDWHRKGGQIAAEATRLLNERGTQAVLQVVGCHAPQLPHLERIGFVDKSSQDGSERFQRLLEEATIMLFPTRAEAAGIVFAEASAYGVPIVSTDTGGVADYVQQDKNGILLPLEAGPEAYADAVQRLLSDPTLTRALSLGGYELYQSKLNWKSSVRRLLERAAQGRN